MRFRLALVLVVALGSAVAVAHASSVISMSLEEMCARADLIVEVQATSEKTRMESGRVPIFTETHLRVESYWKGRGPSELTVFQPGGRTDKVTITAHGVPGLPKGQPMLLFLAKQESARGGYRVVGLEMGAFYLLKAKDGSLWAARGDAINVVETGHVTEGVREPIPRAALLSDLRARVLHILEQSAGHNP